jgi:murein DD-endopeptidase MepM/ murein hydrolase activator NlpD
MSRAAVLVLVNVVGLTASCLAGVIAGPSRAGPAATARLGSATPAPTPLAISYQAPVHDSIDVVRPFQAPVTRYGPGHRGVDLNVARGAEVLAAAPGVVTYAGTLAGRGVVVIEHPDGIRTEYEPVLPTVHRGDPVTGGEPIARVAGQHGGCPPDRCLHWGARNSTGYFDPLTLLTPLGPVRLLPDDAGI